MLYIQVKLAVFIVLINCPFSSGGKIIQKKTFSTHFFTILFHILLDAQKLNLTYDDLIHYWAKKKKQVQYQSELSHKLLVGAEMYPGFQIMGSSGPLLEKFGGPLRSFGGPANLKSTRLINIRKRPDHSQVEKHANCLFTTDSF